MLYVLTSGGDAPGMNAALHALVKLAAQHGLKTVGVESGYTGLIEGRFRPLTPRDVDAISHFGGTVLGSARSTEFRTEAGRAKAAKNIKDASGLVVIGGNGSLTGALALLKEHGVPVVGIPASIDNDIGCTSTAIGVDTALNTIVSACDRISDTARAHRRVFIVEVMGRHCGYLAMASSVAAGADACLFREQGKDQATMVRELKGVVDGVADDTGEGKKRILIIKAEGVQVPTTGLVDALQDYVDERHPGVTVRATVLGHLVRGGNPSYLDRMVAGRFANGALMALNASRTGVMTGWQPWHTEGGASTQDPSIWHFPLQQVIDHTDALLDGSSPVTQRRVKMMSAIAGVLSV
jgi:6-phosphofructokinase 1